MKKVFVLLFAVLMSCGDQEDPSKTPLGNTVPSLAVVNKHSLARATTIEIPIANYSWTGFDIYDGDSRTFVLDKGLTGSMNSVRVTVRFYCGSTKKRFGNKEIDVPFVNGKTTVINMVTQPNTLGCEFFDLEIGS